MTSTLAGPIDLADPDTFAGGAPHEALAELRRTDPVHWQPMDGQPGFWAVLRHADVVEVARHPEIFSSHARGITIEDVDEPTLQRVRTMLIGMDPPRHSTHRGPVSVHFRPRMIAELADRVREIARGILAEVRGCGEVEFVHDVAAKLPNRVIGELFGLPRADWEYLSALAERITGDERTGGVEMAAYAVDLASSRRQRAGGTGHRRGLGADDDLTAAILAAQFGGRPMDDQDFGGFFVQLVTAGNDTTRGMLSSGLLTLLDHPRQLAELRADPTLLPRAVEEIVRYDNPLHYFRRTAVVDTELSGTRIRAGDKVAMYYTSANRDEEVFDDSQRFDIHRGRNPHVSFGMGVHFCLGAHLARLEGRVFFEELLAAFGRIDLAGEPVRIRSNLNNSLKKLPVRLSA